MSFVASLAALSAMTIISVAIGRCFRHVPAFLQSSLPIGEWAGAAMMVYFGVRTLRVRMDGMRVHTELSRVVLCS